MSEADELVSVVIPARDEEAFIGTCLDAVRRQYHRNLQIIVVDGGSRDGTASIVRTHMAQDARVELLHNPRNLITVSLNLALAQARGRWLVRIDAHSTVGPDYVGRAAERLREGRWGGVGGRKDGRGVSPAGRAIAAAMASRFGVGNSTYHHGDTEQEVEHIPFGAYPTELVRGLGGWDERLVANEDFEFDHRVRRAGWPLLFDPGLVIDWHCRQSVGALFRQYRRYGRGKVAVALMHPGSVRPRHLLPPAFVAYAAVAAAVSPRRPAWAFAMLAPYLVALACASALTAREIDRSDRARVAPAFLAMHLGWGIGVWNGLVDGLRERERG